MRRSSGRTAGTPCRAPGSHDSRAQVEPLAAIIAVAAVCTAFTLYAGVLADELEANTERAVPERVLDRTVAEGNLGILDADEFTAGPDPAPAGWQSNRTLQSAGETWHAGPEPPTEVATATRRVSVEHGPGEVRPGELTVVVWQ